MQKMHGLRGNIVWWVDLFFMGSRHFGGIIVNLVILSGICTYYVLESNYG